MHSGNMPVGGFHRAVHSLLYRMIAGIGGLGGSSFFHVEQNVFRNTSEGYFAARDLFTEIVRKRKNKKMERKMESFLIHYINI